MSASKQKFKPNERVFDRVSGCVRRVMRYVERPEHTYIELTAFNHETGTIMRGETYVLPIDEDFERTCAKLLGKFLSSPPGEAKRIREIVTRIAENGTEGMIL